MQERQSALVKLMPAQDTASEQQLEIWRKVARLSHPNLLRLLDCGQAQTGAGPVLYAVFEYPDETLAGAGPLTEQETRDVVASAIDVLRYIHSQGFAHTAIDRDHILALGNQIKLSSDTLREASGAAAKEDARSLAQLASQLGSGAESQWTLAQITEALHPAPAKQPAPELPDQQRSIPRLPKWAYAGLLGFLLILGFLFFPKAPAPRTSVRPIRTSTPPVRTSTPPQEAARELPPTPAEPPAKSSVSAPAEPAAPAETTREYWRLIAFTYSGRRNAEKKAEAINQAWPEGQAEVFSPDNAGGAPFLVALGGRMTRDDAVRLLKIARGKGLPRDIYIQNYSH